MTHPFIQEFFTYLLQEFPATEGHLPIRHRLEYFDAHIGGLTKTLLDLTSGCSGPNDFKGVPAPRAKELWAQVQDLRKGDSRPMDTAGRLREMESPLFGGCSMGGMFGSTSAMLKFYCSAYPNAGELIGQDYDILHDYEKLIAKIQARLAKTNPELKVQADSTVEKLLACFGTHKAHHALLPNEYHGKENELMNFLSPWLKVVTPKGVFKVGWRKRVIELDWSESNLPSKGGNAPYSGSILFGTEDTTVGDSLIHAWSYEKLTEYVERLHA